MSDLEKYTNIYVISGMYVIVSYIYIYIYMGMSQN